MAEPRDLEPHDLTATPGRGARLDRRAVIAAIAAAALVAAGIAVAAGRHGGSGRAGRAGPALDLAAAAAASRPAIAMPYRPVTYRLAGPLADLGASAAVYRLAGPRVDAALVAQLAHALGLDAPVQPVAGGLQVTSGTATLTVQTGGVATVLYERDLLGGAGSSPGSTGSGAPGSGTPAPPPATGEPVTGEPVTTLPATPAPDAATAQRVATGALARMGVLGDPAAWKITVTDGSSTGVAVACPAGADCPAPPPPVVTSRAVTFARVVDGIDVHAADWTVEVAAADRVDSVAGTLGTAQRMGDYPVRSTAAVFDDVAHGRALLPGPQPLEASGRLQPPIERGAPVPVPATSAVGTAPSPPTGVTTPTLVPFELTVTGVRLGYVQWPGADGRDAYLVPTYRFATRDRSGVTGEIEALALTADAFAAAVPTTTAAPVPLPTGKGEPGPGRTPMTIEPAPPAAAPPAAPR